VDPRQLLHLLRKWTPLVVAMVALGAFAGYAITRTMTPVYTAEGQVLVLDGLESVSLGLTPDQVVTTDAALMTEPVVLQRVIDQLHLHDRPPELQQRIQVVPERSTTILHVLVTDRSPSQAARIANTLINDFIGAERNTTAADAQGNTRLQDQITRLEAQLSSETQAEAAAVADNRDPSTARQQIQVTSNLLAELSNELSTRIVRETRSPFATAALASAPQAPSSPRRGVNVSLGAFAGLLLGIALCVLLQSLGEESVVHASLGVPTLGVIPRFHPGRSSNGSQPSAREVAAAGEAYRWLRGNLMLSVGDRPLSSLVVTSVHAGEGKTRTTANLAALMAASGQRVALVDADLRRPSQHRLFGKPLRRGVSEMLLDVAAGRPLTANLGQRTRFPNLVLVTAGSAPSSPADLLASRHVENLVHGLERTHEVVVIDTPSVGAVADGLSLASKASATILVIEPRRTNARQAQESIASLRRVGANLVGIVINKSAQRPTLPYGDGAEALGGPGGRSTSWAPITGDPPEPAPGADQLADDEAEPAAPRQRAVRRPRGSVTAPPSASRRSSPGSPPAGTGDVDA
jgi:polysaccharide biosynthesis transport protein